MSQAERPTNTYKLIKRLRALLLALRKGAVTLKNVQASSQLYQNPTDPQKVLQRDIRALRYSGFIIQDSHSGCYELLSEPLQFDITEEEARLFAALRSIFPAGHPHHPVIESFLTRLRPILASQMAIILDEPLPMQMSLTPAIDYEPHRETLYKIQNALHRQVRIGFDYKAADQLRSYNIVHPTELHFKNGHFYLNAYVEEINRTLEFRIDRIVLNSLRLFTAPSRPRLPQPIAFCYRLSPHIAKRGVSERFDKQEVEYQADGSAIVSAEETSGFRIMQELLRYGEHAELLEPPWLREKMADTAKKMAGLYEHEF